MQKKLLSSLAVLAVFLSLLDYEANTVVTAQQIDPHIRLVRSLGADETGIANPAGIAFSQQSQRFHLLRLNPRGLPPAHDLTLFQLDRFASRSASARLAAATNEPLNLTFDSSAGRLLSYLTPAHQLLEIPLDAQGSLDLSSLVQRNARSLDIGLPQGISFDPATGDLFILDASGPRLLQVDLDNLAAVSMIDLSGLGFTDLRGLALEPLSGNVFALSPSQMLLVELDREGSVLSTRDLSTFGLVNPQGMVFAPSTDQTDDPQQVNLFLADSGPMEAVLDTQSDGGFDSIQQSGQVLELSFTDLGEAAAASTFTSSLVRVADLSNVSPPSTDPSGLAYVASRGSLMMADGEVEETVNGITHFQGANVWELSLLGAVLDTANISNIPPTSLPISNEPTGVAWNPSNGHFYFSDDNDKEIFKVNPGADSKISSGDTWSSFDTAGVGSGDPEGVAYDSWNNRLFVADGVNREVYQFTLAGTLVGQFDVQQYGVEDPESVEFNPYTGTLYVMSSDNDTPIIIETTTDGTLLQTIDISAGGIRTAAGLAYAPASDSSVNMRYYIVDRGIDNDSAPGIIDGKLYEMTAPFDFDDLPPVASNDSYSTDEDTVLVVNPPGVLVNDTDADGDTLIAVLVSTTSHGILNLSSDGSFSYTPNANFNGTDSFSYRANDGITTSNAATVSITVTAVNDTPVANNNSYTTNEDTPLTLPAPGVLGNDTDVEGSTLTAILNMNPANGSLTLNADGSFTYTPNANFYGTDSFTYHANDGEANSNIATVMITINPVNDPPAIYLPLILK